MDSLRRLEELFSRFPGIGPRQAKRFVHYLVGKSPASIKELTTLIEEVKRSTTECEMCHRFYIKSSNVAAGRLSICQTCNDPGRDKNTLMVVARDSDFESIEKSGAYKGLYFILGGTVPILDKEPDKRIRLKSLLERIVNIEKISNKEKNGLDNEIILSLNTTPEGEHTADIVREAIVNLTEKLPYSQSLQSISSRTVVNSSKKLTNSQLQSTDTSTTKSSPQSKQYSAITTLSTPKITILGRGLSTGAELEYADSETIKSALQNRK